VPLAGQKAPPVVIKDQIFSILSQIDVPKEIAKTCLTNTVFLAVCNDENFWRLKLEKYLDHTFVSGSVPRKYSYIYQKIYGISNNLDKLEVYTDMDEIIMNQWLDLLALILDRINDDLAELREDDSKWIKKILSNIIEDIAQRGIVSVFQVLIDHIDEDVLLQTNMGNYSFGPILR
jgi:hypothetical protein